MIEGVAGEFSTYEQLHGSSIDGVDLKTAVLPVGWRDRLVRLQNPNTAPPSGQPQFTGWCLDKKIFASRSCVRCERRTATSSLPCSPRGWSTHRDRRTPRRCHRPSP